MRLHPGLLRNRLLLLLAFTLAALAPAAGAQQLAPVVGEDVPFRISVPEGWERAWDEGMLSVEDPDEEIVIMVSALDLAADGTRPASMSEAETRRVLTDRVMTSDSVLLNLLHRNAMRSSRFPLSDITREIGTLGDEKAGWLSGRTRIAAEQQGWMRVGMTVVDGVLYMLLFMGMGELKPEQESLIASIRDSFVAPEMPGAAASR